MSWSWSSKGMAAVTCLLAGAVTGSLPAQREALVEEPGQAQGDVEATPRSVEHRVAPGGAVRLATDAVSRRSRAIVMHSAPPSADDGLASGVVLAASARRELLNELRQCVAALAGGGFAVAWIEGEPPEQVVRLQYVTEDGEVVFADGGLALATGVVASAVLVPHPTSGVLVAFTQGPEPARNQVIVHWVDREGRTRWSSAGVSAFGPLPPIEQDYHSEPQLLAAPAGGVFVCAMRSRPGPEASIVCQSLSAEGLRRWPLAGSRAGGRPGWKVLPRLVADGQGGVLVLWWNNRHESDGRLERILIEGQRFSADGLTRWGAQGKVIHRSNLLETIYFLHDQFKVVADGAGGAVVVFDDWIGGLPATLDVVAQRVNREGQLLWGRGVPVAAGRVQQQLDSLLATGDGGALVTVWEPRTATRGPLRIFRLLPSGAHGWGRAGKPLSDPAATAIDFASYGFVDRERVRIAWVHQAAPRSPAFDLYLADFTLTGQRLVPPAGLPLFRGSRAEFLRGLTPARESGSLFAVFEDVTFRGGSMDQWDVGGALADPTALPATE